MRTPEEEQEIEASKAPLLDHLVELRARLQARLGPMIDGLLPRGRFRRHLGRIVIGHAFLEGFDALRDIAHQLGNLAASKQQQHHADDDDPVPNTQATHGLFLHLGAARRAQPSEALRRT